MKPTVIIEKFERCIINREKSKFTSSSGVSPTHTPPLLLLLAVSLRGKLRLHFFLIIAMCWRVSRHKRVRSECENDSHSLSVSASPSLAFVRMKIVKKIHKDPFSLKSCFVVLGSKCLEFLAKTETLKRPEKTFLSITPRTLCTIHLANSDSSLSLKDYASFRVKNCAVRKYFCFICFAAEWKSLQSRLKPEPDQSTDASARHQHQSVRQVTADCCESGKGESRKTKKNTSVLDETIPIDNWETTQVSRARVESFISLRTIFFFHPPSTFPVLSSVVERDERAAADCVQGGKEKVEIDANKNDSKRLKVNQVLMRRREKFSKKPKFGAINQADCREKFAKWWKWWFRRRQLLTPLATWSTVPPKLINWTCRRLRHVPWNSHRAQSHDQVMNHIELVVQSQFSSIKALIVTWWWCCNKPQLIKSRRKEEKIKWEINLMAN